ncbi:hypothetical protein RDV89_06170 [Nocardioides zeae]|uniref:SRPBCC family protein n=1 Tax=Nocardioides imazamoxiresistens TaxID=3231893 RepID=A0ABU3PTS6_9ACTN|nr:hypothetical protein [Nocardioides zeae]MDT9592642.1 hypothetical protein [Nocardioides zeae]
MSEEPLMDEVARRTKRLPPPPHVVFESLSQPRRSAVRPWLDLRDGEVEPRVLVAEAPGRVVWSTLWADRAGDEIHLELAAHESETALTVVLRSPQAASEETTKALRHRLSQLFFGELRESYGA